MQAVPFGRLEQALRGRLLEEVDGGPGSQRKDDALAQPEGEGQRWARGKQVIGASSQHVARERVRDGEDVAMEVHRRLRLAGRARSEAETANSSGGRLP